MFDDNDVFVVIVPFSLTSGRMRYAPTLVRLISWLNTVYNYICSMDVYLFWALIPIIYRTGRDDIYFDDGDDGFRGKFVLL